MVSVSQKIMIILSKKMATDATRKYSTLTSSYTVDNNRKYLSRGPNCWIISAIPSMVKVQTWNDLENSLIAILHKHKFPKDQIDFYMSFSVF